MKRLYTLLFVLAISTLSILADDQQVENDSGGHKDWGDLTAPTWAYELQKGEGKKDFTNGWHNFTKQVKKKEGETYHDDTYNRNCDVYEISTPEELAWAVFKYSKENTKEDVYFKLTNDIDLSAHPWLTFGWESTQKTRLFINPFRFIFDGNGHTIKKLYNLDLTGHEHPAQDGEGQDKESFVGLFPWVQGKALIKNLTLDSVYVFGPQGGALIGRAEYLDRPIKEQVTKEPSSYSYRFLENIVVSNAIVAGYGKVELQKKEYLFEQPIGGVVGRLDLPGGKNYKVKNRKDCVFKNVNFFGEVVAWKNRCTTVGGMIGDLRGNVGEPNDNTARFENCIVDVNFEKRAANSSSECHQWMGGFFGLAYRCDDIHFSNCIVAKDNYGIIDRQSDTKYGVLVGRSENAKYIFNGTTYVPESKHAWYGLNTRDGNPIEEGIMQPVLKTPPQRPR